MTSFLIIVVLIAVSLLFFLAYQVWRRFVRRGNALQQHTGELTPIDLEAFENLVDPGEEQFLRTNLSPGDFRRVQRTRLRAAKMYVAALWQNAAVLAAVGESARSNADPTIRAAGQEIVHRAIRLKIRCVLSVLRMNAALVFPAHFSPSSRLANQYMLVTYMAASLPGKVPA